MPLDAPVSITSEIQKLDADSLIELYELDTSIYATAINAKDMVIGVKYIINSLGNTSFNLLGASSNTPGIIFTATAVGSANDTGTVKLASYIYYFHSDVNTLNAPVVWQGVTYTPFPLEATGFESSGVGSQARPKVLLANIFGMIGGLTLSMSDLVGCTFIRKRTFVKYLDAVNFPGGVNPLADSNAHFPNDLYYVDRKSKEDKLQVEFELASKLELNGVVLPRRQIVKNLCSWNYKGPECGYKGTNYFNEFDEPCGAALDKCGKRLGSCEIRFNHVEPYSYTTKQIVNGQEVDVVVSGTRIVQEILPFGGFPAVGLIR